MRRVVVPLSENVVNTLFTIGYEGASLADFLATLRAVNIGVLVDVRDVPISRKPGFSKKVLAAHLEDVGIRYLHLPDLGDPKAGRDAARRGDTSTFIRIFRAHLDRGEAQAALGQAVDIASELTACLFCFERDPAGCHRSIVAEAMTGRQSFLVTHLGVRSGLTSVRRVCREQQRELFPVG